jgi:AhpD family alkylhydroperoxidase
LKPSCSDKPARLGMNRIANPATSRAEFELMCLAVSAVAGCETHIQAHESAVLAGGLAEDHVHDAVRIAAVVNAAATALDTASVHEPAPRPRLKEEMTMYPSPTPPSEKSRKAIAASLNQRLAGLDLHSQIKVAHWNIKGPHFAALHPLFETFAVSLANHNDGVVPAGEPGKMMLRPASRSQRRGSGVLGVQPLELGVLVENREVGIAARPARVPEARLPGLA